METQMPALTFASMRPDYRWRNTRGKPLPIRPRRANGGANQGGTIPMSDRKMTEAQRAYEARRAAKAGMSLEKWLVAKERRAREEAAEAAKEAAAAAKPPEAPKKPGFFSRLLEKAQKPL